MPRSTEGGTSQSGFTIRMLIFGEELNVSSLALRQGRIGGYTNFEVHGDSGPRIDPTQSPSVRPTLAHFDIAHIARSLLERRDGSNDALDLALSRRDDFHRGTEGHGHVSGMIGRIVRDAFEDPHEGFLEDGLPEGVAEDHESPRGFDELLHLEHPDLIQTAREDVHHMHRHRRRRSFLVLAGSNPFLAIAILGHTVPVLARQPRVELTGGLVHRLGTLGQVGMRPHIAILAPTDDGSGAGRAGSPREEHDARPAAGTGEVEHGRGDGEGAAGASRGTTVGGDRPGVLGEVFEDGFDGERAGGDGEEEAVEDLGGGRDVSRRMLAGLLRWRGVRMGMRMGMRMGWCVWIGGTGAWTSTWTCAWTCTALHLILESTAEQFLDFPRGVLLIPPQHIILLHALEAQLVHLHIGPKRDQSHQTVLRQQIERLRDAVRQLGQLLLMRANVHHKDEHRRTRVGNARGGEFVFAACELRNQLGGQVLFGDVVGIVRREVIAGVAEGTYPEFGSEVHLAVRIEDGRAGRVGAADGFVREGGGGRRGGGECGQGSVQGADGGDDACGFQTRGRPCVERETDAVRLFPRCYVPPLFLHCGFDSIGLVLVLVLVFGFDWFG